MVLILPLLVILYLNPLFYTKTIMSDTHMLNGKTLPAHKSQQAKSTKRNVIMICCFHYKLYQDPKRISRSNQDPRSKFRIQDPTQDPRSRIQDPGSKNFRASEHFEKNRQRDCIYANEISSGHLKFCFCD